MMDKLEAAITYAEKCFGEHVGDSNSRELIRWATMLEYLRKTKCEAEKEENKA